MTTLQMMWDEGADRSFGLPSYETAGAAGADLRANFPGQGSQTLAPGERAIIPTGLRMAIPLGFEVQIRPRSGLAVKHGLGMPNSVGTIDSDYRGPLGVAMINMSDQPFEITHGMRIAQMIMAPVVQAQIVEVTELDETARGVGGFGSTGTK